MPKTPRLFFTPRPELVAAIETISRLTGKPGSRLIGVAVVRVTPPLVQIATNLEWIEKAEGNMRRLSEKATGSLKGKLRPHEAAVEAALTKAMGEIKAHELRAYDPVKAAEREFRSRQRRGSKSA
jgi:hypothetical protein